MSNEAPEKQPCDTPEHDSTSTAVDGNLMIAAATSRSQDQLSSTLDRLTGELDKLLEDAPLLLSCSMLPEFLVSGKELLSLNSLLKSIQRRLDNIDHKISAGLIHEKSTVDCGLDHENHKSLH
ncbi:hypothetical protein HAX54_001341 [Datura stramonium]|uniref:Biogenesis of lysosome-related organelles complex 1 subunit 7 n=1 Tax=Datura stramonium TaxID=4076 RepID=A0ABS8T4E6_DATST|nr:hypothetical protein [Datura stramonium]